MEFNKKTFDFLIKRNSELKMQVKSDKEFSKIHWLNESQIISQIGSWHWDISNNIIQWSDTMYQLLGLEPNEKVPSYELALHHIHSDDKDTYESSLATSMETKKDYYFENRIVKKDSSIINVISRGICVCDDKNNLIRMAGTVQDITHIKQLLETNKQLEQFADILSHDFKAPIRTIVSFIGLIKKEFIKNLTEEGIQYFSFIESGAINLSDLVNDLLEFSKMESPELNLSRIPLKELMMAILFDLSVPIAEKKGTISLGWLPEFIYVDRIKIRQVLQNLISNAIKYTSLNTKPDIYIYCEEDENNFTFFVKDQGIGIEKEFADKIFDPYIRIDNEISFSGTGIGLSICKRIIDLHHGSIGHFANEPAGSCFFFSVPKFA